MRVIVLTAIISCVLSTSTDHCQKYQVVYEPDVNMNCEHLKTDCFEAMDRPIQDRMCLETMSLKLLINKSDDELKTRVKDMRKVFTQEARCKDFKAARKIYATLSNDSVIKEFNRACIADWAKLPDARLELLTSRVPRVMIDLLRGNLSDISQVRCNLFSPNVIGPVFKNSQEQFQKDLLDKCLESFVKDPILMQKLVQKGHFAKVTLEQISRIKVKTWKKLLVSIPELFNGRFTDLQSFKVVAWDKNGDNKVRLSTILGHDPSATEWTKNHFCDLYIDIVDGRIKYYVTRPHLTDQSLGEDFDDHCKKNQASSRGWSAIVLFIALLSAAII